MFPSLVTHYSRGEPFGSITRVPRESWAAVVAGLTEATMWGLARFADPDYLHRRLAVEAILRRAFVAAGGEPEFEQPAYAVVGRSAKWERQRSPGMYAHVVSLARFPSTGVSFTFGDSLLTWDPRYRADIEAQGRFVHPLAGRLFLLEELRAMADVPTEHLEAQLWRRPADDAVTVEEVKVIIA